MRLNSKPTSSLILILSIFILGTVFSSSTSAEGRLRELLQQKREARQPQQTQRHSAPLTAGDYTFSLQHQHQTRQYFVHIPKSYQPSQSVPMVVALHGGGGNMHYQANDEHYQLISKSEQAGFIAVFPNGYSRLPKGKLATWNAGICCGKARDAQIDDVGFIKALVADIKTKANINPSRIYATGMSNGGMMAYRLACELSDTFSAIASVTGTDGTEQCTPSKPVSILHIHALDDDHVLFNGGSGVNSQTHADFVSVPNTIKKWVNLNACNATPQRVFEVKGAYCDVYTHCNNNTQVKLCVTETGGHSWPGGKSVRAKKPASSQAINATDLIWEFYDKQSQL